ncbi:Chloroperoxidase [Russula aff. rugulosa BPL654]|nr:Chloroperoxidase [Russula aff. rugulosa BPL654]
MLGWMGWDFSLFLVNLITFKRKVGHVTPKGRPGEGGVWPKYVPQSVGDSRSLCPALNALANHSLIPHDGRHIYFRQIYAPLQTTYNLSPSFCDYMLRDLANSLNRSFITGRFDLHEITMRNGIKHDASHRRREAQRSNGQYSQYFGHKTFGSSNVLTLLRIFDGRLNDIYTFLTENRIPNGWESRVRDQMGLTFFSFIMFNRTVSGVERGIKKEVDEPLNLL